MLASDIAKLAKASSVKQLAIVKEEDAVLGYINLSILELHKKFNLIRKEATITMADSVNVYELSEDDLNVDIDLSDNKFMLVTNAYNHVGDELAINKENDLCGIFTPTYNTIKVPDSMLTAGENITALYRAAPLFLEDINSAVPLPPQFTNAILNYMAYLAHCSVKGDMQSENNTHYLRFEKECKDIKSNGLFTPNSLDGNKFQLSGMP